MSPEDPRHGQNRGYVAGCRSECCQRAHMRELKKWRMTGPRLVPSVGTVRRIRALQAIGWSLAEQSRALGKTREYLGHVARNDVIRRSTAADVAELFDKLSERVPEDPPVRTKGLNRVHEKTRRQAARQGFAPPSAWFGVDIDDPAAQPDPGWSDPATRGRNARPMAHVVEDFDWLVSQGEAPEQAAAQIGVQLETVERYRQRTRPTEGAA